MSLNKTPRAQRPHIAIFGMRNAGKSSLINAITNQSIAIVSEVKGTTTDPVYKSMEILPLGPVVLIDTAGLDDDGELGNLRVKKSKAVIDKTDIAIVVIDSERGLNDQDITIIETLLERDLKPLVVFNKADKIAADFDDVSVLASRYQIEAHSVSAKSGQGIDQFKEVLAKQNPFQEAPRPLVGDLIRAGDVVILVTPIDGAAPKGRLILPQQQVLRDILDHDAVGVVCKETQLAETLRALKEAPALVITDSQAFQQVAEIVPDTVPLTGFSLLFARYKGDFNALISGAKAIKQLGEGARILVAEGCTHHRQDDDIGTVKIPQWLQTISGKRLTFDYTSGEQFTENFKSYDLIVHCGACMLNQKAVQSRIEKAQAAGVPIVNYGVMIAYVNDMLERALRPFPEARALWQNE